MNTKSMNTYKNEWADLTIGRALKQAAAKWSGKEALASDGLRMTYSELFDTACKLAIGLSRLGIQKGDSVATVFGLVPEWIFLKYALHILGAKIVPINNNFRGQELQYILKKADVKIWVTTDQLKEVNYIQLLSEIDPEIINSGTRIIRSDILPMLEKIICFSPQKKQYPFGYDFYEIMHSGKNYNIDSIDELLENVRPTDICNILFTSGSTAFPKGVMHNHVSLLGIGRHWLVRTVNLNSSDKVLCYFPFYHITGCVYYVLGSLWAGSSLYINEFQADRIATIIEQERIAVFVGFEAHFAMLMDALKARPRDLSSVKFVFLAAGPSWYDKCRAIFPGVKIIAHNYGFTEGTGVSTSIDEKDHEIRKNTNGRPWPGIEVKVVDPLTNETLPPNSKGELCLRGWSQFQGYYNNEVETKKAVDDQGYFHTGDYGWMDEQGNVVYRGRYKMMIKSGGENVSEREVEVMLEELKGVKAVQVVGVPDKKWGEAVTAIVELEKEADITAEEIISFCKAKKARFKTPKKIIFVEKDDWPLLGSGKIDKSKIRKWAISTQVE